MNNNGFQDDFVFGSTVNENSERSHLNNDPLISKVKNIQTYAGAKKVKKGFNLRKIVVGGLAVLTLAGTTIGISAGINAFNNKPENIGRRELEIHYGVGDVDGRWIDPDLDHGCELPKEGTLDERIVSMLEEKGATTEEIKTIYDDFYEDYPELKPNEK